MRITITTRTPIIQISPRIRFNFKSVNFESNTLPTAIRINRAIPVWKRNALLSFDFVQHRHPTAAVTPTMVNT